VIARRRGKRRLVAVIAALALAGLGATGTVAVLSSPRASDQASTGNEAGSLATLRRAVQENPRDAAAHDALANALAETGDLAGALREFNTAATIDPTDVVALSYSGWIALLAGSTDKALPRLAQAEAVDPGYPDAHAFRGIALLRAGGDQAEAVAELQRYLQLAPAGPMTQQVRDVLTELGQQP
jgi:Flp pilus assembly protein TadD